MSRDVCESATFQILFPGDQAPLTEIVIEDDTDDTGILEAVGKTLSKFARLAGEVYGDDARVAGLIHDLDAVRSELQHCTIKRSDECEWSCPTLHIGTMEGTGFRTVLSLAPE